MSNVFTAKLVYSIDLRRFTSQFFASTTNPCFEGEPLVLPQGEGTVVFKVLIPQPLTQVNVLYRHHRPNATSVQKLALSFKSDSIGQLDIPIAYSETQIPDELELSYMANGKKVTFMLALLTQTEMAAEVLSS